MWLPGAHAGSTYAGRGSHCSRYPAPPEVIVNRRPPVVLLARLCLLPLVLVACSSGSPAAQPRPTDTTGPSPTASPSPTPPPVLRYPLTGLPGASPAALLRPVLSVKIDNVGPARPQLGLNAADIVVDTPVEGGLTRLFAAFQSHGAPLVGPIRSARPVDADLLRLFNGGILAYSGADPREIAPVRGHSHAVLVSNDADPRWFDRSASRPAPHNVVSSTARLYEGGSALGRPAAPPAVVFPRAAAVPAGLPTRAVALRFSGLAGSSWTYLRGGYQRSQDGSRDLLADGTQVTTENVVVMSVVLRPSGMRDAAHNEEPFVVVVGSGACWVLRDGVRVAGRWVRPTVAAPLRFVSASGAVIPLRAGRTWLELLPQGQAPVFSSR